MIRFLLIPLASLLFLSCEEVYTSDDELFYQMSEADSARCMEEILDGILEEARVEQERQEKILESNPIPVGCFGERNILDVWVNSSGQVMIGNELDSNNISEKVYRYFMFNRNLNTQETNAAASNSKHPGFEYPFYNRFGMEEIDQKIAAATEEWEAVKNTLGADQAFIDYHASKIEAWKVIKKALEMIRSDELPEITLSARIECTYQKEMEKTRAVLKEIAFAFYQMRNTECIRYFGETYLRLYDRAQRKKSKLDTEKLEALEILHPASIFTYEWRKPIYNVEAIPQVSTP